MIIYVQYLTGVKLALDMEPSDSIDTIKRKIHDVEGLPPDAQLLVFAGKRLKSGRNLQDYSIHKECVLHLVPLMRGGGSLVRSQPGSSQTARATKSSYQATDSSLGSMVG